MTGKLDKKVWEYFHVDPKKYSVISQQSRNITTTKVLIKRSNLDYVKELDIRKSSQTKSFFKGMGFVKRAATIGRHDIPEDAKKKLSSANI